MAVLFTVSAWAQDYPDSGFTNKAEAKNLTVNGLKEGKWVENADTNKDLVYVMNPYKLIVYKKGKPFGIVRLYDRNWNLVTEIPYLDGERNGIVKNSAAGGKIEMDFPYVNDTVNGIEKTFNNGKLVREVPVLKGKTNGVVRDYFIDGKLRDEIPYSSDKISGMLKRYYENGKIESQTIYNNGVAGPTMKYDSTGHEIK